MIFRLIYSIASLLLFYRKKMVLTRVEFYDNMVLIFSASRCGVDKIKEGLKCVLKTQLKGLLEKELMSGIVHFGH